MNPVSRPVGLFCCAVALCLGCSGDRSGATAPAHPFIVVGADGLEWSAIEELWEAGELPELRRLAQAGARTRLATDYGASPVIWTTIATGVQPRRHGILGFTASTKRGNVPISSGLRKVPAIWNMASTVGLRVAVVGWWGSWPAEQVNGVLVTDRVLRVPDRRIWPESRREWLESGVERALAGPGRFEDWSRPLREDEVHAHLAARLAREDFDLILLYLRAPDVVGHIYWRYFRPRSRVYGGAVPDDLEAHRDRVPNAYRAVDTSIAGLLAEATQEANVIVLSDHGFQAARTRRRVFLDLDGLLEHVGLLVRNEQGVLDMERTRLYTHTTPAHHATKHLRFPTPGREPEGRVSPRQRGEIRRDLETVLQAATFGNGKPAFDLRDPTEEERPDGADLIVEVNTKNADETLLLSGEEIDGVVRSVDVTTGGHHKKKHGVFLATGPDIDPNADLERLSIFDITPTLLYGLGLPTARDLDGKARVELFTAEFRKEHPLRTIETWGTREALGAERSRADSEILDELRALGYLD